MCTYLSAVVWAVSVAEAKPCHVKSSLRTFHQGERCGLSLHIISTWWGIISGTPVTLCRNSDNYCPKLMILSELWTEIICVQAQTKICHCSLILLLHYLAETKRSVCNYQTPWLLLYKLWTNSQKLITCSRILCYYKQQQHFNSADSSLCSECAAFVYMAKSWRGSAN